ncbi:MAG TPA: hypothetical protein P5511_07780, partial [Candidatus Goldiibacteriota bacterium]|nr:hypothetical protein [Candidatus Goldiibacteriota bacterium]
MSIPSIYITILKLTRRITSMVKNRRKFTRLLLGLIMILALQTRPGAHLEPLEAYNLVFGLLQSG